MDNPVTVDERSWSPPLGLAVAGWVLTAAAAGWLILTDTAQDRVVAAAALIVLLVLATGASVLRPRLVVDSTGLRVRGPAGTQRWPWETTRVRVQRRSRLGITTELLELDTPPEADDAGAPGGLTVLSRLDLGAAPEEVAADLDTFRP